MPTYFVLVGEVISLFCSAQYLICHTFVDFVTLSRYIEGTLVTVFFSFHWISGAQLIRASTSFNNIITRAKDENYLQYIVIYISYFFVLLNASLS
jgi:hypothetical protein